MKNYLKPMPNPSMKKKAMLNTSVPALELIFPSSRNLKAVPEEPSLFESHLISQVIDFPNPHRDQQFTDLKASPKRPDYKSTVE
jgi:hypothetical protein